MLKLLFVESREQYSLYYITCFMFKIITAMVFYWFHENDPPSCITV